MLLTNATDYSAKVVVTFTSFNTRERSIEGRLLARKGVLFFSPARGDRSFIWNANAQEGFSLSDALQGFALFKPADTITHVGPAGTNGPIPEMVGNQPARRIEVVVSSNDGSLSRFVVWRTADPSEIPLKIRALDGTTPYTLELSEIRKEPLPEKLFAPPDDFTRYASVESMRDELATRQKLVGAKNPDSENEMPEGIGHGDIPSQIH